MAEQRVRFCIVRKWVCWKFIRRTEARCQKRKRMRRVEPSGVHGRLYLATVDNNQQKLVRRVTRVLIVNMNDVGGKDAGVYEMFLGEVMEDLTRIRMGGGC